MRESQFRAVARLVRVVDPADPTHSLIYHDSVDGNTYLIKEAKRMRMPSGREIKIPVDRLYARSHIMGYAMWFKDHREITVREGRGIGRGRYDLVLEMEKINDFR